MSQLSLDSALKTGETLACRLTPSGRIDVQPGVPEDGPPLSSTAARRIIEAFNMGRGHGLLHLGVAELVTDLPPSLSYWRDLGRAFVARVCGALDPTEPKSLVVPGPEPDELSALVQAVPPMQGAELLSPVLLVELWSDMGTA
ncbi:MAG: hypothetical protein WBV21_07980, partial [Desulfobacterales bacterium]